MLKEQKNLSFTLWNDTEFWRKISWKHAENSTSERVDFNIFWGSTRPGPPRSSHLWRSRHLRRLFWKSGYGPDPLSNQCHHLTKQINHVFVHKTSYKWQLVLPCATKTLQTLQQSPCHERNVAYMTDLLWELSRLVTSERILPTHLN